MIGRDKFRSGTAWALWCLHIEAEAAGKKRDAGQLRVAAMDCERAIRGLP